MLLGADLALEARCASSGSTEAVLVLDRVLDTARERYDVIIVEAPPPGLGLLSANALLAADGLIMPVSSTLRDLSALAQFWTLLPDVYAKRIEGGAHAAQVESINIVISPCGQDEPAARTARQWAVEAWGDKVPPVELPELPRTPGGWVASIYDLPRDAMDAKSRGRAADASDRM